MPPVKFHLAWFLAGSTAQSWRSTWSGHAARDWQDPALYIDIARSLERACFDYILLEDNSFVADAYRGSMEIYLKNASNTPRPDPAVLAACMLQATSRIGIVPTLATFAYPPYLLARMVGTLDQVSAGRAGWNMVTGSSDRAVQNFGMEAMLEHDLRYEQASEFLDVTNALWDSWAPDAILADRASQTFADHTKVRTIDFDGRWYKVRGPLNSGPAPQGRPVLAQAGGSPRGRQFAAEYADTIVCSAPDIEGMRSYRDDIRDRMKALGRNPDDCKVLYTVSPVIGTTEADALERLELRRAAQARDWEISLATFSKSMDVDLSQFDPDIPLEDQAIASNGTWGGAAPFMERNRGRTLREVGSRFASPETALGLVGTVEQVADRMIEIVDQAGGDGFLFGSSDLNRRTLAEITDGLVPALQDRGAVRDRYDHPMLRENLLQF